jgi:hypothetical protein
VTVAFLVLMAVGVAGCLTFVVTYWLGARTWHQTPVGQNLMAMAAVLGALLVLSLVNIVWDFPEWLWLVGLALLDAVMWWRVVLLWKVQHQP